MSTGETGALGTGESGPSTQQGGGRAGRAIAKGGNRLGGRGAGGVRAGGGGSGSHQEAAKAQGPWSRDQRETGPEQGPRPALPLGFQARHSAHLQIQMLRSERWRGWSMILSGPCFQSSWGSAPPGNLHQVPFGFSGTKGKARQGRGTRTEGDPGE